MPFRLPNGMFLGDVPLAGPIVRDALPPGIAPRLASPRPPLPGESDFVGPMPMKRDGVTTVVDGRPPLPAQSGIMGPGGVPLPFRGSESDAPPRTAPPLDAMDIAARSLGGAPSYAGGPRRILTGDGNVEVRDTPATPARLPSLSDFISSNPEGRRWIPLDPRAGAGSGFYDNTPLVDFYRTTTNNLIGGPESPTQALARTLSATSEAASRFGNLDLGRRELESRERIGEMQYGNRGPLSREENQALLGAMGAWMGGPGINATPEEIAVQRSRLLLGLGRPGLAGGSTPPVPEGMPRADGLPRPGGTASPVSVPSNIALNEAMRRSMERAGAVYEGNTLRTRPTGNNITAAITDFVSSLPDDAIANPDSFRRVRELMLREFGGPALDRWFTARFGRIGGTSPHETAVKRWSSAINRFEPGSVGTRDIIGSPIGGLFR